MRVSSIWVDSSASRSGRNAVNVLPSPGLLFTVRLPCIPETSLLAMASPNPKPGTLRALSNRSKAVNIRVVSSSVIPVPVSCTEKCNSLFRYSACRRISPCRVNLMALESRLFRICWSWERSPLTTTSRPEKAVVSRSFFFLASEP